MKSVPRSAAHYKMVDKQVKTVFIPISCRSLECSLLDKTLNMNEQGFTVKAQNRGVTACPQALPLHFKAIASRHTCCNTCHPSCTGCWGWGRS